MTRPFVLAAAVALGLTACQGAARDSDELDQARVQVHRFFDALGQSDCPTLASLLPAAREPGGCDKLLHEWRDDLHIKLIDLPDARRDGRDRRAIIVRATVLRHDEEKTMLVRVTHEQGVWQLVL